jgi:hypothetical protein
MILVRRRAVQPAGHILPGEDRQHAGQRRGAGSIDIEDARVRVRRPQHLQVQQALDDDIHRVVCQSRDNPLVERVAQTGPEGLSGDVILD